MRRKTAGLMPCRAVGILDCAAHFRSHARFCSAERRQATMSKRKQQHQGSQGSSEQNAAAEASADQNEQEVTATEDEYGETEGATLARIARMKTRTAETLSTAARAAAGGARQVVGRGVDLVKEHPTATAAVVIGVGAAVIEAELAAAALVGVGVTMLVTRKSGPELRRDIGGLVRRGRAGLASRLARLEQVVAPAAVPEPEKA